LNLNFISYHNIKIGLKLLKETIINHQKYFNY